MQAPGSRRAFSFGVTFGVTFGVVFGVVATGPKRNNDGHMGHMGSLEPIYFRALYSVYVGAWRRSAARLSCARADCPYCPCADVYWFSVDFDYPKHYPTAYPTLCPRVAHVESSPASSRQMFARQMKTDYPKLPHNKMFDTPSSMCQCACINTGTST